MLIRPIRTNDLPALLDLAGKTGVGLTTLPRNEAELKRRITLSTQSFMGQAERADEIFLFVLEDTATRHVAGICAIATAIGLRQACYSYRVGLAVHASQELGVFTQTQTLFLSNDHTGRSELCSLFLDPDYRRDKNGSLLSKARFLFIAQFHDHFSAKFIAELRGPSDASGKSPFWESLGRRFFSMDFSQADYLTGIGKKSFVAELMPKHPMYCSFLTEEAQAAIGQTHELTRPALALLESEGFRYEGHVDIFDAGPTLECATADIDAVAQSRLFEVTIKDEIDTPLENASKGVPYLVSNTRLDSFRATLVQGHPNEQGFVLAQAIANALGVKDGEPIRAVALSPKDRYRPASSNAL